MQKVPAIRTPLPKSKALPKSTPLPTFLAISLTAAFLIATVATRAQDIPAKPNPPTRVNDFAHVMTQDQIDALERKLVAYNDSTTSDIVVITEPDIGNSTIEDYALKILRTWGVGDKK